MICNLSSASFVYEYENCSRFYVFADILSSLSFVLLQMRARAHTQASGETLIQNLVPIVVLHSQFCES